MSKQTRKKLNKGGLIIYFIKGSTIFFLLSILFNLIFVSATVLIPRIVGFTIDSVLDSIPVSAENAFIAKLLGGVNYLRSHYYIVLLAILGLASIAGISKFLNLYIGTNADERLMQRMRNTLFFHLQRLPMSWHIKHRTGDIIQRCTSDTQTILTFISTQMMSLIRIIVLVALSLTFMFILDAKLAAIAATFIPILFLYSLIFQLKAKKHFKKCDEEEGVLSAKAQENLSAVRVVRAFGKEGYEKDKFNKQNEYYTGLWVRLLRYLAMFWSSSDFLAALQLLFIVVFGTKFAIEGSVSPGELVVFISYNTMLIGPVRELGRIVSNMSKAGVSLERIGEIINAEPEVYGEKGETLHGDIVFDNVGFAYSEGGEVLKNLSFTVKENSSLGIIGATGSGKSSISYLLDGLYAPSSGSISIGGIDISSVSLATLRASVGIVLQNGHLYSGTLKENLNVLNNSDAQIEHAAEIACIDQTIKEFSRGYDTVIGERGVTLSGGQKQRVNIARTLLKSSPILIFDDSLSAVDSETDVKIRKNLSKEYENSTVIIISHRITTVMNCDNIIVLDDGKIIEQGTNEELINKGGIYKKIYDRQMSMQREAL